MGIRSSESINIENVTLEIIEPEDGDMYMSLTYLEGEFAGQHVTLIVRTPGQTHIRTPRILKKLYELKQAIKEDKAELKKQGLL